MKVYSSEQIRNIAFVGHGGTGKTSLTEAMLFQTGVIKRMGRIEDGNTVSDFTPEETKRKITISTGVVACEYKNHKINILDTPGYSDFYFEVVGAVAAADVLVFVVSANAGVEVQTQIIAEDYPEGPKLAFINRMDREHADFQKSVASMKETFSKLVVPVQLPIGAESSFKGIVDLIQMKAYTFEGGAMTECPIPSEMQDEVEEARMNLIEAAAEGDDELMMKYLDGEELTQEEIQKGITEVAANGAAVLVFCGSATKNIAIQPFMDFIVECCPSPLQVPENVGKDLKALPAKAQVFKTIADPYIGRLNIFKLLQGKLKSDDIVYNVNKDKEGKVNQLLVMVGKDQQGVPEIAAGDIAAVAKLSITSTGDTLVVKGSADTEALPPISFPEPTLANAIAPKSKGDEDKLGGAIQKIMEEDPSLTLSKNVDTNQTLLTTMGDTHMDILKDKLARKFGVEVVVQPMKIPYKETIRMKVEVEGKHKKQSGGHGQYGHVWIRFEPNPDENANFTFKEEVFGGSVPRNFFPAVEKGLVEALDHGVLAGYPVTGIQATLYDGSYHPVDSSEMAFKTAAHLAFKKGMESAKPVLLEPIMDVEILIPDAYMGDIIGDLNSKRGRVMGMEPVGKKQLVKAQVPQAEMARYTIDLKSMTQGRGKFHMEFSHYEEVPAMDAEKIIAQHKAEEEK